MAWAHKCLVAIDQTINVVVLNGHDGETISAHAGRAAQQGAYWGRALCWLLNLIQRNHGERAEAGDLRRARIVVAVEEEDEALERRSVSVVEVTDAKKPLK